ncbi:hypothetical protein VL20_5550 [Microcystis panniformis FACHB-1757]|uniref:Uncharacterized protein n=1 Tax=Microcystis panniformis FACHB-1757 TaxID=1638788 RepID=A0A0K1S8B7_9CHRO|nr:hypothetical protein VL20_5550 [Microcystis panniformis FACHB-1757]
MVDGGIQSHGVQCFFPRSLKAIIPVSDEWDYCYLNYRKPDYG